MTRSILLGMLVGALLIPAAPLFGRGGFGGGGRGRGNNQNKQNDPAKQAEQIQDKIDQYIDDGFAALKAFDTAAALEDFSDVVQLEPDNALAHIGLGLAKAQKGKFAASETEFSAAMSCAKKVQENPLRPVAKSDDPFFANPSPSNAPAKTVDPKVEATTNLRLATFDLAVAYSRASEKSRALVLLDRLLAESKPTDEMMLNAQRSLLATMDDKTQSAIAALPNMVKTLDGANATVRAVHTPLRRWGVVWMASDEVTRRRMSRETEPLPLLLPFLLPNDEVLPEGKKPDAPLVNPLAPIVMGASSPAAVAAAGTTQPAAVAGPASNAAAPAPATTAPSAIAANAGPATQPARTARTVTGAAFAVAPDMLLTCSRIAAGAKALRLQSVAGTSYSATLIAADDATGLALIKVEGARFVPLALAGAAHPGAVTIAAFTRPGVFGPELQVLHGELTFVPGAWLLRVGTHPRSAGSPLVNDRDQIVAMLTATRDDATAKLPVVTVDAIRKFVEGKIPPAATGSEPTAEQSVLELSAIRED